MGVEQIAHPADAARIEPVDAPRSDSLVGNETRFLQRLEVLRHGRAGDGQSLGELSHRCAATRQSFDNTLAIGLA